MGAGKFTILLKEWSNGDRTGHTLQPTALIHEAYIKLVDHNQNHWHSRSQSFSVASSIMREILVDHARKHQAAKRGGGDRIALDDALTELARFDERRARLIELKYFGGLSGEEIEKALGISVSTITRESRLAEAWLQRRMSF